MYHDPVLLHESVEALQIRKDGIYVDATFGGGGHSGEIIRRLGSKGKLFAFDQDKDAVANAINDKRFTLIRSNFRYLKNFLRYFGALPVHGILADLGVSSHQFDTAERGFSTRYEGKLDMRMNISGGVTAADVVNRGSEQELTKIFATYGEIPNARRLARDIVEYRRKKEIATTADLKEAAAKSVQRGKENQYFAQLFQALRIEVNQELTSLREFLSQCAEVLAPGGRLAVIAYHSLEDRLVKNLIQSGNVEGADERDVFGNRLGLTFRAVERKPVIPSAEETARNPRARSAKLRIAERI